MSISVLPLVCDSLTLNNKSKIISIILLTIKINLCTLVYTSSITELEGIR